MSRVALLVNFIPPYRVPLLEALAARVDQLRVFVSTRVEPNRPWVPNWGSLDVVVQRSLMVKKQWHGPRGFDDVGYVHMPFDTIAHLWRYRPDVIISGELGLRSCLAATYKMLRPATTLVLWATVSQRTERHRGALRQTLRPLLASRADAVLVNGASGARYVGGLGVPASRIGVIPYTTDITAFASTCCSMPTRRTRRILYVGLLVQRKGMMPFAQALIRWAARNPDRSAELWIAGDGPERSALEQLPRAPNLRIRFLGTVPYERLAEVYRESDIVALPTLEDEWGVVINEAMATGRPVLGSLYSQAVEELVDDGATGWVFRPDKPHELDVAVSRALEASAEELSRMSIAARERAMALAPTALADRMVEVLRCAAAASS
jgi:glycosyltransferase involved in cell wall biosynthesis